MVLKIFEYTEKIRMVFLELYCLIIVVVAPISSFLFNKTKQILRKILVRQIICLTNNKHGFSSLYDIDDDLRWFIWFKLILFMVLNVHNCDLQIKQTYIQGVNNGQSYRRQTILMQYLWTVFF